MADGWIALNPRCPVHGQMHYARYLWTCPGWDGEGCEHTVLADDLDWQPATDIDMTWESVQLSG